MIVRVRGQSMAPTLLPGDLLWARPYRGHPQRGDLALIRLEGPPRVTLVKRVIGLPGEFAELRQSRVVIDRVLLPEPYAVIKASADPTHDEAWRLGPDEFVVLGDARDDSLDSRRLGPINRSALLAHVSRRFWPLHRCVRF
jgi:signal peptidase I